MANWDFAAKLLFFVVILGGIVDMSATVYLVWFFNFRKRK